MCVQPVAARLSSWRRCGGGSLSKDVANEWHDNQRAKGTSQVFRNFVTLAQDGMKRREASKHLQKRRASVRAGVKEREKGDAAARVQRERRRRG